MSFVEADGLLEGVKDTGRLFIGQKASEGEAGMIVNGDVQGLDAGARVAMGAIAGGPHAGAGETAQFLNVEVKELAGMVVFVAHDRRFGRFQGRKAVEVMTAQDARTERS